MSCFPKSCHEHAIEHLITAMKHARAGRKEETLESIESSKRLARIHAERLKAQGKMDEHSKYLDEHQKHVDAVSKVLESQMAKSDNTKKCCCDSKKTKKSCTCGYMNKESEDVKKAFVLPNVPASPARKEFMETGKVKPTREVGSPKGQSKYTYKPVHELHPDDQLEVQRKFPRADIASHAYPIDAGTGRLAHAPRVPITEGSVPKASAQAYQKLEPHHRAGAAVRVMHQGKEVFGVVRGTNPNMPGKLAIQTGHHASQQIFAHPSDVKPSNPQNRIEKAILTLYNIRKAFMKE